MKMRAVTLREYGGPEVLKLEEIDAPEPGPCEVRVAVRACALNHLDVWVRRGLPGRTLAFPHILGSDVAGVVGERGPGAAGGGAGGAGPVHSATSRRRCGRGLPRP